MDFSISEQTSRLLATVREYVREDLYPLEEQARGQPFRLMKPVLEEKRREVSRLGFWLPQISQQCGGAGLGFLEYAMLSEELARSPFGHYCCNAQAPDAGNMEILMEFGSDEQKNRWLNPLTRGEIRSCFSMTASAVLRSLSS